jgi:hypothetical protein
MNIVDKTLAVEFTLKKFGGTEANFSSIMDMIDWIISLSLSFAGIIGVVMILYSGFLYVSSFGKEDRAETAKKTLIWSIVGTAVVASAKVIVDNLDKILR